MGVATNGENLRGRNLRSESGGWLDPHVFAGDPVTMKMTVCRQLQPSCISNLWVATPAPQRTKKVGAFSAI